MMIAGVDDAGRGPVIGSLFIAGVLMNREHLPKLVHLGVKDSKLLSSYRREVLAAEIKKVIGRYYVLKLSPREIDEVVLSGKKLHRLNRLEAKAMAKVIEELRPEKVYVDASDVLEQRFRENISECLSFKVDIVSEHKADKNYPIVSAASIIAKVERDEEIRMLREVYGDLGSGYPADPKTIGFLQRYLAKTGVYPDFVRKSWKTAQRIKNQEDIHQKRL